MTRERLEAMLDYEYLQCDLTLRNARGDSTAFFAFAETVTAKAYNRDNECHGWLGIKYQSSPRRAPAAGFFSTAAQPWQRISIKG